MTLDQELRSRIRSVPDFPKPGIVFRDLTPVFQDVPLVARCLNEVTSIFPADGYDAVGGIEARGFVLGALVAHAAGKPFFPFRKAGKLPWQTVRESYSLEYGQDAIEMHVDAFTRGDRVLVVDDLLATGGTAVAAARLVRRAGGEVRGVVFLVELAFLDGRRRLASERISDDAILSLLRYSE